MEWEKAECLIGLAWGQGSPELEANELVPIPGLLPLQGLYGEIWL